MLRRIIGYLDGGMDRLNQAASVLSASAIAIMGVLVFVEVTARKAFGTSTLICEEVAAYLLVVASFMALGYTFRSEGHIRIELLVGHLSGNARKWLMLWWHVVGAVFVSLLLYRTAEIALDSYRTGVTAMSVLATPVYLPQAVIPVGLLLLLISLVARVFRVFAGRSS